MHANHRLLIHGLILGGLFLFSTRDLMAQSLPAGQRAASFEGEITKTVRLDYLLYLPEEYDQTDKKWPLILFLHLPTWVFHGAKDTTVPLEGSQEMVDALKATGADPKFTIYPDAKHDSWTETYNNEEVYAWLFGQRK